MTRRAVPAPALSPAQIRWLGVLLLASQLPQLPFVPLWVAGFGATLVVLRLALLARDRRRPDTPPARIPALALAVFALLTAAAIRVSFGYFVGREPCVSFLFVLVGIKYLEAKSARDATLLVCLASFLLVTPFFYSQSPFSALAGLPALFVLGATLQVLAHPPGAPPPPWRVAVRRAGLLMLQGIPLAALLFVLFPRLAGPLWGLPNDTMAQTGLSDRMAPGFISELSLSDAIAFRVDFEGPVPPPSVSSVTKIGSPFRLKVYGSDLDPAILIYIAGDSSPWPVVKFKSSSSLVIKGGTSLKSLFPKGVGVPIRFVNPDGQEATFVFTR